MVIIVAVVSAYVLVAIGLFFGQSAMIYHPRAYGQAQIEALPKSLVPLRTETAGIVAFYREPPSGKLEQLWVLCNGNADLALEWDSFAQEQPQAGVGYLMVEYPGYGSHKGKPSPATVLSACEQAMHLLATHVGETTEQLFAKTNMLGHSLGAASVAQFAVQHPPQRLVLISPFTSMLGMAKRSVGWPLYYMLTHRYDNEDALKKIMSTGKTRVAIVHGINDQYIPVTMGQALAKIDPAISVTVVADAGHNDVFSFGADAIRAAMK